MAHQLSMEDREFHAFRRLILEQSGIVLSDHKRSLLCSRLIKRLRALALPDFAAYYRYLKVKDPSGAEMRQLVNAVTTNKTEFYRERHHFAFLRDEVLKPLVASARSAADRRFRVWSAACSSGEEPYTIALTLAESLVPLDAWNVRILASDIDTEVLARAQRGRYPLEASRAIAAESKRRWCRRISEDEFEIDPRLKRLVAFRQINFIRQPWPIRSTFDVIFCRNAMIYFGRDTQRKIYERFHQLLAPGGYLVAGHSENLRFVGDLFDPIGQTIYQRGGRRETQTSHNRPRKSRVSKPELTPVPALEVLLLEKSGAAVPARSDAHSARAADPRPLGRSVRPRAGPKALRSQGGPRSRRGFPRERTEGRAPTPHTRIQSGELFSSQGPALVSTVLGSCVACCLHDPEARVGGMNHFMLPTTTGSDHLAQICFGANAMELLINELLKLGAQRQRLKASAFGAANVVGGLGPVGNVARDNARFIREYLQGEGIALVSETLGGKRALGVTFATHTGRARVRRIRRQVAEVRKEERRYEQRMRESLTPPPSSVTLF